MKRAFVGAALLLAGCGYVGAPLPPTVDIPQHITDLAVVQYGDKLRVQFNIPHLTTEGLALKSVRLVELYAAPPIDPWNVDVWAATAKHVEVPALGPGPVTFETPASQWIGKEVAVAIRVTGPKIGRAHV